MTYRCYIQTIIPEVDEFCLLIYYTYLCVTDEVGLKVWQSNNELASLIRFGLITWFPVGWKY